MIDFGWCESTKIVRAETPYLLDFTLSSEILKKWCGKVERHGLKFIQKAGCVCISVTLFWVNVTLNENVYWESREKIKVSISYFFYWQIALEWHDIMLRLWIPFGFPWQAINIRGMQTSGNNSRSRYRNRNGNKCGLRRCNKWINKLLIIRWIIIHRPFGIHISWFTILF